MLRRSIAPLFASSLFTLSIAEVRNADATAGLAEWAVPTPSGNYICHTDPHIDKFTIWLSESCQDDSAYAERLIRWKFLSGFVIGESEKGFFIFNENNKQIQWLSTEEELIAARNTIKAEELSRWLEPADAYFEAWFSPLTWKLCRYKVSPPPRKDPGPLLKEFIDSPEMMPFNPPPSSCKAILENELPRYFRTTLKQACEKWPEQKKQAEAQIRLSKTTKDKERLEEYARATSELCAERERYLNNIKK